MPTRRRPPPPSAPEKAVAWFADRVPYTREQLAALEERARKRAFYVSNVAQVKLVGQVLKSLQEAVKKGTTLQDFKKQVSDKLSSEWGEERPAVVETIFRNGVQSSYNAGRLEAFEDPLVKHLRPLRGWSVILDSRTTETICRPLAKLVVDADSRFAKTHIPPLHHRCRSSIVSLSRDEATPSSKVPRVQAQEGFGGDPRSRPAADLSDVPPTLRRLMTHKLKRARSTE